MLSNLAVPRSGFAHSPMGERGFVFAYSPRLLGGDQVRIEAQGWQQDRHGASAKSSAVSQFREEKLRKDGKLKIVLLDDNHLFRSGLCELLTHCYDFNVLGAVGSIEELRALLKERPDLLVMEIRLKPVDGLAVLKQLRMEGCTTPAVMLSMSDSDADLGNAIRAGVRGYLLKDMAPDEVADAIGRAAAGEFVIAPGMTVRLIDLMRGEQASDGPKNLLTLLTGRELEILKLLSRGDSNKSIAQTLSISAETVKQHVRHILNKLQMSSRVKAAILFIREQEKTGSDEAASNSLRRSA